MRMRCDGLRRAARPITTVILTKGTGSHRRRVDWTRLDTEAFVLVRRRYARRVTLPVDNDDAADCVAALGFGFRL